MNIQRILTGAALSLPLPALAQAPPHHRQGVHQGDGHQPQGGDRRQATRRLTGLDQAPDDQIAQEHTAGIAEKHLAAPRPGNTPVPVTSALPAL